MKNKRAERKRFLASLLAVIMVVTMLISIIAPFLGHSVYGAQETSMETIDESENVSEKKPVEILGNFDVKAEIGFDNKYIVDKYVPFKFIVSNNGSDIKGELQVKVYNFLSTDSWRPSQYSIYFVPIELNSGGAKEIEMKAHVPVLANSFSVSIVNENGETVYLKNYKVSAKAPETVWTGVLSEMPSELDYLKEFNSVNNERTKHYNGIDYFDTINFGKENFPNDVSLLNNFKVIIINNFNTSYLSAEQKEALKQWIEMGGTLLVGTGANAGKVLGGLSDIFSVSGDMSVLAASISEMSQAEQPSLASDNINVNSIQFDEGDIFANSELPFASGIRIGSGSVVVLNFDMGERAVAGLNGIISYFEKIYSIAVPELTNISNAEDDYYNNNYYSGNQYRYYPVEDYATRLRPYGAEMLRVIYIVIACYIILAGPVIYIFLKRKDKREKAWVLIPVLSIAVTVGIYVLGFSSYYRKGIVNFVSEVVVENGSDVGDAKVFAGVAISDKGSVNFTAEEPFSVLVNSSSYYSYDRKEGEICKLKINAEKNKADVTFFDSSSWKANEFSSEKTFELGGAITADISFENGVYTGTVTNNGNIDLYDVVITTDSSFENLGDCRAGETINVNFDEKANLVNGYSDFYERANKLFGLDYEKRDLQSQWNNFDAWFKVRVIDDYNSSNSGSFYEFADGNSVNLNVSLYAFNYDRIIGGDKFVNGEEINEQWQNVFIVNLPVEFKLDGQWQIPFGYIKPMSVLDEDGNNCINDYSYGYREIYVHQAGKIVATFNIPEVAKGFIVSWVKSNEMTTAPQIYNRETNEWEDIKSGWYDDISAYVDELGNIELSAVASYGGINFEIPEISLKGGE